MDEESWVKDISFLLVACLFHGGLLAADPALVWSSAKKAPPKAILVDFVTEAPSLNLAPVPASDGNREGIPGYGSGKFRREKIKKTPRRKSISRKIRSLRRKQAKRRRHLTQKRKLLAKVRRQHRKEAAWAARQQASRRTAQRREAARQRAAQRRELVRVRRAARAARRRKRVELSRELASLSDPDEVVSDAMPSSPDSAPMGGGAVGEDLKDALNESDTLYDDEPQGKSDMNLRPAGGGLGQGGSDVSWSIEGDAGLRRLLSRSLPKSPAWVSQRGLDLRVSIRFQVGTDGRVKRVIIKETSGFPDLDRRAMRALKRWRFDAVPGKSGQGGNIIGVVTFRFTV